MLCHIFITVQCGKDLKKIDPDAYEKMFSYERFVRSSIKNIGYDINYIFGSNNKNEAAQNLLKTYLVSRVLISLFIFVETAIVAIVW